MHNRVSVFRKVSFSDKDRQKWEQSQVLTIHFMSSEESDVDEEEVLVVKQLPWRSQKVNRFLNGLDEKHEQHKSPQARRQEKRRVRDRDVVSSRPRPSLTDQPDWVFAE